MRSSVEPYQWLCQPGCPDGTRIALPAQLNSHMRGGANEELAAPEALHGSRLQHQAQARLGSWDACATQHSCAIVALQIVEIRLPSCSQPAIRQQAWFANLLLGHNDIAGNWNLKLPCLDLQRCTLIPNGSFRMAKQGQKRAYARWTSGFHEQATCLCLSGNYKVQVLHRHGYDDALQLASRLMCQSSPTVMCGGACEPREGSACIAPPSPPIATSVQRQRAPQRPR